MNIDALNTAGFISLTTFRKNGNPVSTPISSLGFYDGKMYFMTVATAGKLKRLRHTKRVQVAPCKSNGEVIGDIFDGEARILSEDEAQTLMDERKFGVNLITRLFFYILEILGRGTTVYLEVTVA